MIAPSDLDIIIPLYTSGNTKPSLAAKRIIVELIIGNIYWINEVALVQPDVVLLWVGWSRD